MPPARDRNLTQVLQAILDRLARLERPVQTRVGPVGGAIGTVPGYTFSVDATGHLIATSDNGTVTVLAAP